jgi:hypothetical protein
MRHLFEALYYGLESQPQTPVNFRLAGAREQYDATCQDNFGFKYNEIEAEGIIG